MANKWKKQIWLKAIWLGEKNTQTQLPFIANSYDDRRHLQNKIPTIELKNFLIIESKKKKS